MYAYLSVPVEIKEQLLFGSKQMKSIRSYFWLLQGFRLFLKEIKKMKKRKKKKKVSIVFERRTNVDVPRVYSWMVKVAGCWLTSRFIVRIADVSRKGSTSRSSDYASGRTSFGPGRKTLPFYLMSTFCSITLEGTLNTLVPSLFSSVHVFVYLVAYF